MKIEIWSDIFCPFCYIGKRKFENALRKFNKTENIEVIYRSFELNPYAERINNKNIHEEISRKYGISYEKAKENNDNIVMKAKELGLEYNFDKLILTNSFDAHRMIHFAKEYGKMEEMKEALFKAYFTEGKNISDAYILSSIAKEIGLDETEAMNILKSDKYSKEVRYDENEARKYNITSVPTFVFNENFKVTGAQSEDVFLMALDRASKEDIINFKEENRK